MGYDLLINKQRMGYISYNHSCFSQYWHVSSDWDNHTVEDVRASLQRAIDQLKAEDIAPCAEYGCDASDYRAEIKFKASKDVFMSILIDLLFVVSNYFTADEQCTSC